MSIVDILEIIACYFVCVPCVPFILGFGGELVSLGVLGHFNCGLDMLMHVLFIGLEASSAKT